MSRKSYRRYNRRSKSSGSEGLVGLLLIAGIALYSRGIDLTNAPKYAVIVGLIVFLLIVIIEVSRRLKVRQSNSDVSQMNGFEYEKYVAKRLKDLGYTNIRLTEKYDLGVDIIANKDGLKWGIQVKKYSGLVGAEAVRQVVTALNHYGCDRAMVITNSTFSEPAKLLARSNNCVVLNKFN